MGEMMKLIKISKNGKVLLSGHGVDKEITDPVKIEFIVDETDYNKFQEALKEHKWNAYDALCMLCKYADELISEMDRNSKYYFTSEV